MELHTHDSHALPTAVVSDADMARGAGKCLYLCAYDLERDVKGAGRTPEEILEELGSLGEAFETCWAGEGTEQPTMLTLFATVVDRPLIGTACGLADDQILSITGESVGEEIRLSSLKGGTAEVSQEAPAPSAEAAPPAPPTEEDLALLEAYRLEVEELLLGAEGHIRTLQGFVFGQPFEYAAYVSFLSGLDGAEYLEAMKGLNRFLHTVKGNSGFLGVTTLSRYCHTMEELTLALAGGSLYLGRAANDLLQQVPSVVGRVMECLQDNGSDAAVTVDGELAEIEFVRAQLIVEMGGVTLDVSSFQKLDLGRVRPSAPALKVTVDLAVHDGLVQDFQGQAHDIAGLLATRGLDPETVNEVRTALDDHLNRLLLSAQCRIVLTRYQRIVADLGRTLGKRIAFVVPRNDANARPDVWDHCHNALVHLVRNAVDHGIEMPEQRVRSGKPEEGRIELSLREDHKSIYITLSDDGGGIDDQVVGRLAVERGLVSAAELATMSRPEVQRLIFQAGFSTRAKATDVSGRGVGMDAVLKEIEGHLNGTLRIDSEPGVGTTIAVELPKAETLTECVFFGDDEFRYAIPKVPEVEYLDCEARYLRTMLGGNPLFVKGRISLPLLDIMAALHPDKYPCGGPLGGHTIIKVGGYGLAVPQIFGHGRIKVERKKALSRMFGGDGTVFGYGLSDPVTVVLDLDRLGVMVSGEAAES